MIKIHWSITERASMLAPNHHSTLTVQAHVLPTFAEFSFLMDIVTIICVSANGAHLLRFPQFNCIIDFPIHSIKDGTGIHNMRVVSPEDGMLKLLDGFRAVVFDTCQTDVPPVTFQQFCGRINIELTPGMEVLVQEDLYIPVTDGTYGKVTVEV